MCKRWGLLLPSAWLLLAAIVHAHEPITLHYTVRPPYTLAGKDAQSLEGIAGQRVIRILHRANIPFRLNITVPLRQLNIIKDNKGRDCTFDWYKTIERLRYAKFSEPFAQDSPYVYVTHSAASPPTPLTLSTIKDSGLTMVRVEGYAYGETIDNWIKTGDVKSVTTHGEESDLLIMIMRLRADFALMLDAEVRHLLQRNEKLSNAIRIYELQDHPEPEFTYFLCSQKVDEETMKAFNRALAELPFARY